MSQNRKGDVLGHGFKGDYVTTTDVVVLAKIVMRVRVKSDGDFMIDEKLKKFVVECEDDVLGRQVQARLNKENKPGLKKKD